jgi:DNA-binding SARP family transcriptional activator
MRIYLTGRLTLESGAGLLDETELPARQGRLAFAYLVMERQRPLPRQELAQAIWGDEAPDAWDASLSALLSRLRRLFRTIALDGDIETVSGSVSLHLPADTWVDLDEARNAIDEAEGALRSERHAEAWTHAAVALSITGRGFLAGEELRWVVRERERLRTDHVRALECLAEASLSLGDGVAALRYARECAHLEPYRESAYERMMRAHLANGNRAEALRVYEGLRSLLAEELGTDPSAPLEAAYLKALRG